MKKLILLFLLNIFCFYSNAQLNLVPNPSFELKNSCPIGRGYQYCKLMDTTITPAQCIDEPYSSGYFDSTLIGWTSYKETPDYFNACAPNPNQGVPNNIFGYQTAYDGDAYVGITTYNVPRVYSPNYLYDNSGNAIWDTINNSYIYIPVWDTLTNYYAKINDTLVFREMIGTKLDSNLTIGVKYFVTFWTCRAKVGDPLGAAYNLIGAANNNLGMRFSSVPYSYWIPISIDNFAQINYTSIISDSLDWTRISGSFIADSSYGYISIGNFFDGNNTAAIDSGSLLDIRDAYYYIDDVCVSSDSLTCYALPNSVGSVQEKERINVYPNPFNDFINIESSDQQLNEIRIYDPISKLIFKEQFTKSLAINTQSFNNGLYFYYIVNKNGFVKSGKIIK
jgi:hypothetical protein